MLTHINEQAHRRLPFSDENYELKVCNNNRGTRLAAPSAPYNVISIVAVCMVGRNPSASLSTTTKIPYGEK